MAKDLREEKGEDLRGGKTLLREEREKIWGQRP